MATPPPPPSPRFTLVHTLSHLLIQEISHEAGYAAASIRERLYARTPDEGSPMAGVLLYTAAPDSEGTLGGLVALGAPDRLGDLIDSAIERASICTSDPFCATHLPNGTPTGAVKGDGSVHGAACHVCLFLPETSCDHAESIPRPHLRRAHAGRRARPGIPELTRGRLGARPSRRRDLLFAVDGCRHRTAGGGRGPGSRPRGSARAPQVTHQRKFSRCLSRSSVTLVSSGRAPRLRRQWRRGLASISRQSR